MEYLQRVTETIQEMSNNCKIKPLCSAFHIRRATEQAAFQTLSSHILSEVIVFYFTNHNVLHVFPLSEIK